MRVLSFPVPHRVDPAVVFSHLYASATHAVWLDSGTHATSGMSLIGVAARSVTASVADATITVDGTVRAGSIFEFLRSDLRDNAVPTATDAVLGWVGWLGYELRSETMVAALRGQSRYPDASLVFLDRAISFDHSTGAATLLALGDHWRGELLEWRDSLLQSLAGLPDVPRTEHSCGLSGERIETGEPVETAWAYSDDEYLDMIRDCQQAIVAGDAYLLCLTTEARVAASPDPVTTYLALRRSSPTHHGAFLRMGGVSVLSASPEQFLQVSPDGVVQTSPIKGTRRRGKDPDDDARLKRELESSVKERAENLMIVDLMRNDIGRIARTGSVSVSSLLAVETYSQVHQLVSTVRGTLAEGVSGMDAVVSCFPAGSMTGAPKQSATELLDRLERRPRGIYSGVLGYFALDGRIDLSMVIRSIVIDAEGSTVGTGGGITALSDPQEELDEVHLKAAALLRVLGATVR
jgi:para-aminobenzoate synthetase component 1